MRQAVQYLSPRTLAEALELLHAHAGYCKPYAGGTDLMVQLRDGAAKTAAVQYLMDLQHLPELFGIQKNADSITVGAMETHARIAPGCVFAAPDRVPAAEQLLIGQAPSDALFAQAAEAVAQEMIVRTGVRWSTAYKQPALTAVVVQTLHDAWEMAK